MIDIIDFNNCEKSRRSYGGRAGLKTGIIYNNQNYMIKFPKNT